LDYHSDEAWIPAFAGMTLNYPRNPGSGLDYFINTTGSVSTCPFMRTRHSY
jgi:hypothetical protein